MALLHGDLTESIIGCGIKVHRQLGSGLLESVYVTCLCYELGRLNIPLEREVSIPIVYDGLRIDAGFKADIIVAKSVIVEAKAVEKLAPIHEAQLLTHLKLSGLRVGLLMNFNALRFMDGLMRRVI